MRGYDTVGVCGRGAIFMSWIGGTSVWGGVTALRADVEASIGDLGTRREGTDVWEVDNFEGGR